jgi:predicted CoA-substrate-specific enzyme activase
MPEDFFAAYAAALLGQAPACMRMQFREEVPDDNAAGIICHTVKFCDYYSFQYARLRKNAAQPILKVETDCTPQSSGQLATRLEAFSETLGVRRIQMSGKTNARYAAGVDSGSASTDVVILDRQGKIVGSAILPTGAGASAGADKALEAAIQSAGITREDIGTVVSTGYGRDHIAGGNASVTEITCHARGAHHLLPGVRTIIDIGGQDSKVIRLDENGQVINFVMNDKCAAGTGRFLELMARTLEMTLPEMSEKGRHWNKPVSISSMCTVFAESEVVSLIAGNTDPADIIHGLNMAVANKTASLVMRLGGQPAYVMTGGVAMNRGVVEALEEKLKAEIIVPREAQLCGALGAALFALDAVR